LNKTETYGISIPICLVFVSLLINSSYAQSMDNFKTYTNNDLKFSIEHPSNWNPEESHHEDHDSVYFQIRKNPEDKTEISDILFHLLPAVIFESKFKNLNPISIPTQ
jgi:hypothetical protein